MIFYQAVKQGGTNIKAIGPFYRIGKGDMLAAYRRVQQIDVARANAPEAVTLKVEMIGHEKVSPQHVYNPQRV